MGLVATEPVRPPSDPAPDDGGAKVESLTFWPVIVLADLRRSMHLGGQVTTDRLMFRTIEAVAHVNDQLLLWCQVQVDAGYQALAEIPADPVNGELVKVWRYKKAVLGASIGFMGADKVRNKVTGFIETRMGGAKNGNE